MGKINSFDANITCCRELLCISCRGKEESNRKKYLRKHYRYIEHCQPAGMMMEKIRQKHTSQNKGGGKQITTNDYSFMNQ